MNAKLEEVRAVYEARRDCLRDGSHTCGGSCYALTAPNYSYNGGPYTPEARLRAEALAGDEDALDALLTLEKEATYDAATEAARLRAWVAKLQEAGPGHVLLEDEDGTYHVAEVDEDSDYGYETAIVTHYDSDFSREILGVE